MKARITFLSSCLVMTTMVWAADANAPIPERTAYSRWDMALVWTADVSGKWTLKFPDGTGNLRRPLLFSRSKATS